MEKVIAMLSLMYIINNGNDRLLFVGDFSVRIIHFILTIYFSIKAIRYEIIKKSAKVMSRRICID